MLSATRRCGERHPPSIQPSSNPLASALSQPSIILLMAKPVLRKFPLCKVPILASDNIYIDWIFGMSLNAQGDVNE